MKAVFDTKPSSGYDDDVTRHYQFPLRYRDLVAETVGDWVVLRRPRADGGDLAYFAVARVTAVEPDLRDPTRSFARLAEFLPFDRTVAWWANGRYAEEALRLLPRQQVGVHLRGRSVRELSGSDFAEIVTAGFADTLSSDDLVARGLTAGLDGALTLEPVERERRAVQVLTNRILRDASFRRTIVGAYDDTCAVTGLRIIDAVGRSEVQAAHVWPVAGGGPDVIQNGIALCGTAHWLFDRHLISLDDDYRLLISKRVPSQFNRLVEDNGGKLRLPKREIDRPHRAYIAKHRAVFLSVADVTVSDRRTS